MKTPLMRALAGRGAALFLCLSMLGPPAGAATAAAPGKTAVEDLGGGRYRIGEITVDKAKGRFSVPGAVIELHRPDSPIEFIAVTKGGYKRYEAIFEMDASAVDFNLACILIGLEAGRGVQPKQHFDPEPLTGAAVEIAVSWEEGQGKERLVPATDVLQVAGGERVTDEWVYTGSAFSPDGKYMAEEVGTLVGFVHDPASIIQHRQGLGLGDYGAVTANHGVLPRVGAPVVLHVARPAR